MIFVQRDLRVHIICRPPRCIESPTHFFPLRLKEDECKIKARNGPGQFDWKTDRPIYTILYLGRRLPQTQVQNWTTSHHRLLDKQEKVFGQEASIHISSLEKSQFFHWYLKISAESMRIPSRGCEKMRAATVATLKHQKSAPCGRHQSRNDSNMFKLDMLAFLKPREPKTSPNSNSFATGTGSNRH